MQFSPEVLDFAMEAALAEAQKAAEHGEFPYGAVVASRAGTIVARTQDRVVRDNDPTRHAEIEAVRAAITSVGPSLAGYALVSNVEPCAMCATAAWWAEISTVAFGLSQKELFAIRPDSMSEAGLSVAEAQANYTRKMKVISGIKLDAALGVWQLGQS